MTIFKLIRQNDHVLREFIDIVDSGVQFFDRKTISFITILWGVY